MLVDLVCDRTWGKMCATRYEADGEAVVCRQLVILLLFPEPLKDLGMRRCHML